MALWLPPFLLGCLAWQGEAVAQVAAPRVEHLAVHGRRTTLHHGRSTVAVAEVGRLGEVGLHLSQNPQVIISIGDDVVFGNLMLAMPNPRMVARNYAAQWAAHVGIEQVVRALNLTVREVGVSLVWSDTFPRAVRVDFNLGFHAPKSRQAFTKHVVTGGASTLVGSMCRRMPKQLIGQCKLPEESQLGRDDDKHRLSLSSSGSDKAWAAADRAGPGCFGTVTIHPKEPPQLILEDPQWQEAVAMAIAREAWVSRLQVGTLMAVVANSLRVDFWLIQGKTCPEGAIKRVAAAHLAIASQAYEHVGDWSVGSQERTVFPVYGRILLEVPSPMLFAGNRSATEAVENALARVAASPGPEASQLSVRNLSASLATVRTLSDAVQVGFRVDFDTPRDRQVFAWDFSADGGEKLADGINQQAPSACKGHCRLPGQGSAEETASPHTYAKLGKRFGTLVTFLPYTERMASDPLVHEAMAMAISEMASVRNKQVGVLVSAWPKAKVVVDLWVASRNLTLRQAAVLQIERAGRSKFLQCTMAQLDRLHLRDQSKGRNLVSGSVVLQVPDAQDFANSTAVRWALHSAVARVAAVPREKVHVTVNQGLMKDSPQLVRLDFQVAGSSPGWEKDLTRALAGDGGKKFVEIVNELLPKPFRGQCRLPTPNPTEVARASVNSIMSNSTQPYGSILLYTFIPERHLWPGWREFFASTIAEVAGVPRSQVGIVLAAQSSGSLLTINFWVAASDAALRQAAIQHVNAKWSKDDLKLLWHRVRYSWVPVSMVSGGSVAGEVERFKCQGQ